MFSMVYPLITNEVPQACSATYNPLWTSPNESGVVLPCSWVIISARSLWSLLRQLTKSNMYRWRAKIREKLYWAMGFLTRFCRLLLNFRRLRWIIIDWFVERSPKVIGWLGFSLDIFECLWPQRTHHWRSFCKFWWRYIFGIWSGRTLDFNL